MPRLRNAQTCLDAAMHGLDWLIDHLGDDDGGLVAAYPLPAYCKVPYLLVIAGRLEECRRTMLGINANLFAADGELLSAPAREGEPLPAPARTGEKTWLALAAHLSGRFDISFRLIRLLAEQQGGATGGVYNLDSHGIRAASADVRSTAAAGLAFLTCGLLSNARDAGRFLCHAIQRQTDDKTFHVRLDTTARPIRTYSRAKASTYVVARARGHTQLSYLGLPVIFLAKLHLATGDADWLEAAMDYYAFAEQYSRKAWSGEESGSLCWAASALYGITRRRVYYDAAERVAQAWIQRQRSDGSWPPGNAPCYEADILSLTAETGISLLESIREAQ